MALRERTERRILDAAEDLFFAQGVAATPIDQVIARAGVSAATLYRGYPSKERLLAAALERRERAWVETWDGAVARETSDAGRLLAVFDALDEFRRGPRGARWCAFLGAAAEYADAPAEVADAVRLDTETFRSRLSELAAVVAGDRGPALAEQLLLLVTGYLGMRLRDPSYGVDVARDIAATIVGVER